MLEQVRINGYAYGGLSQVPESEYGSCSLANEIAIQVGAFGHTPSQLKEMLVDSLKLLQKLNHIRGLSSVCVLPPPHG